ncbi:MAG: hypothetical protein AB8G22_10465 [Saprospiraceae bacterium]
MKNIRIQENSKFVCVNCWGRYEYDGIAAQPAIDLQRDVNAKRSRHHFIKDWLVRFVDGIMVKKW